MDDPHYSAIGQGTILGPLFFLGFFNDSDSKDPEIRTFNFADDKKLAVIVKSVQDTLKLQKAIDEFSQWCRDNHLELNTDKCKIMTFSHKKSIIQATYTIDGKPIERVNEIRDLGVMMDPKLSFLTEYAKNKADNMLAFVKRESFKTFNTDTAKTLYGSLVRSHLEFASSIWLPNCQTHIDLIERTQKQAVIFLHQDNINRAENNYVLAPYNERCADLKLVSLQRRRINASVLFLHKIISGRVKCPDIRNTLNINSGQRTLRNPEFIRIRFSRTEHGLSSPLNLACRLFNHAALFIDPTIPFDEFKTKLLKLPDSAFGQLAFNG